MFKCLPIGQSLAGSQYGVNGNPYNKNLPSSKCQCQGLRAEKNHRDYTDQEFLNFFEQWKAQYVKQIKGVTRSGKVQWEALKPSHS